MRTPHQTLLPEHVAGAHPRTMWRDHTTGISYFHLPSWVDFIHAPAIRPSRSISLDSPAIRPTTGVPTGGSVVSLPSQTPCIWCQRAVPSAMSAPYIDSPIIGIVA